jgi:hypothetical protein
LAIHLEEDEPSMSFTRNVMDQVKHELKPVALKTKVDNRIIYAIGGFFVTALLGILGYAFATADFKLKLHAINLNSGIDRYINTPVLGIFVLLNAVLLLIYLDSYFRKDLKKTGKKP